MWVYISIASVTVITLAWFFVVMVSARLRQTPAQTVLDIEEAVEFIADNLPKEVSMRVTHDEVRLLLSCLLYTSPSPRDKRPSRMPSSA